MKVVSTHEMRELDRHALEVYGIEGLILMENAGRAIARIAEEYYGPLRDRNVTLVCGKGNNGGDGLVTARHLLNQAVDVRVYLLTAAEALKGDARKNLDIYKKMGGALFEKGTYNRGNLRLSLMHSHVIIDAIFGTGLHPPLTDEADHAIQMINEAAGNGTPVLSIDIPSGVHGDTGEVIGNAVKASCTITLALPKRGHFLFPGAAHTGRLQIEDIGIPTQLVTKTPIPVERMEETDVARLYQRRPQNAHKGTFGHVLVIAGSKGMSGAALLTAHACLRTGAGLVTLAIPRSVQPWIVSYLPEILTCPLPENNEGSLSLEAEKALLDLSRGKTVVALGPGLSTHRETMELVRRLTEHLALPLILDADGIQAVSEQPVCLVRRAESTILTPHPGEMGRLCHMSGEEVQARRIQTTQSFCSEFRCHLVLKGAYSLIGTPDGSISINPTGNPGMATAGSGDVLTGMIAGLVSQGLDPFAAAKAAVYAHGLAGDLAAEEIGETGMLAGDIRDRIPKAIRRLRELTVP